MSSNHSKSSNTNPKNENTNKQTWSSLITNNNYHSESSSWPKLANRRSINRPRKPEQDDSLIGNPHQIVSNVDKSIKYVPKLSNESNVNVFQKCNSVNIAKNDCVQDTDSISSTTISNEKVNASEEICKSRSGALRKKNVRQLCKEKLALEKQEKRRKREEEIRRRMIFPKDEHLKIIDSTFKDLVDSAVARGKNQGGKVNVTKGNVSNFQLKPTSTEFPDLHSRHRNRSEFDEKSVNKNSILGIEDTNVAEKSTTTETLNSSTDVKCHAEIIAKPFINICSQKNNECVNTSATTKSKRKVRAKRNTPIQFDLRNALRLVQEKNKNQRCNTKHAKSKVLGKVKVLSGNILDSDNPIRKRGKQRENRKKTYTKLKKLLINEKECRKLLMDDVRRKLESEKRLVATGYLEKGIFFQLTKGQPQLVGKPISGCHVDVSEGDKNVETNIANGNENDVEANDVACVTGDNVEIPVTNQTPVVINDVQPKALIHNRKFRSYCDQWPDVEMEESVFKLINMIVKFQDRLYASDPIKAKAKRRYVCGFHEVMKVLKMNKAKLIIIATDIDCDEDGGSLLDLLKELTSCAETLYVPYVYSGKRYVIRGAFKKRQPISCGAILNYQGAEEMYKKIITLLPQVKETYLERLRAAEAECGIVHYKEEDVTNECIKSMLDRLTLKDGDNVGPSDYDWEVSKSREGTDGDNVFMKSLLRCAMK